MLKRLLATSLVPRCLIGASVLRVVVGCVILYQYAINYGQRHYLFGPDGVFSFGDFTDLMLGSGDVSLYRYSSAPVWFELVFHLGIAVAVAWTLGWRTRWTSPLNYVLWLSLHNRFPYLWDGGDNLMEIVLIYALFADVGAYLSFDAARRRLAGTAQPTGVLAIVHNGAMLAIAFQVCLVYGIAGLAKVQSQVWQNGTALYYALRAPEYRLPGVSELLYDSGIFLTLLAHATVAFQVAFPFLVFASRRTRTIAVAIGISFHVAIGSVMGLVTFALFLIAADLALVDDDEYRALGALAARVRRRLTSGLRERLRLASSRDTRTPSKEQAT
jgi:hypothetical protein